MVTRETAAIITELTEQLDRAIAENQRWAASARREHEGLETMGVEGWDLDRVMGYAEYAEETARECEEIKRAIQARVAEWNHH